MAAGDIRQQYRASSTLTTTNLQAIASASTYLSGWTSGTIDNTTNLDLDLLVSAQFQVESTGVTAGEIRVYLYTMRDDSTWPDIFSAGTEGTEGTCTLHDTEIRDSALYLLWATVTDTTVSRIYSMPQVSVLSRLGFVPAKCAVYVTQNTGTTLENTGSPNVVVVKGVSVNVAQS